MRCIGVFAALSGAYAKHMRHILSNKGVWIVFCVLTLVLVGNTSAYAYLDPGAGSQLFQLLMAGLLGAVFSIKAYWKSCKKLLRRLTIKRGSDNDGQE